MSKMIEQNNLVEEKDIESFGRDIYIYISTRGIKITIKETCGVQLR